MNDVMEECKELQIEKQRLKDRIKDLENEAMDLNNYKQWSYREILQWILNLEDGRFKKYKSDFNLL